MEALCLDNILLKFVYSEPNPGGLRQHLTKPFLIKDWNGKDYYGASDAYSYVIIPKDFIGDCDYSELEKPDMKSVLAAASPLPSPKEISFNELSEAIGHLSLKEAVNIEETECNTCKGEGSIECFHCGHEDECSKCGGEGSIVLSQTPTGRFEPIYGQIINVGNSIFQGNLIYRLYEVAKDMGVDRVVMTHGKHNAAHVFMVSDVATIGIMPCVGIASDYDARYRLLSNDIQ